MKVSGTDGRLYQASGRHACHARARALAIWLGAAAVLVLVGCQPAGAAVGRDSEPAIRIPLAQMGYQTLSPDFLLAGSSMLTVDFVDNDHLLVTFGVRRLMKREVDDPADDEDRTIGAFLVELPSGKVLARTEWRVHDRSQYLWNLGQGRFLLRVRDRLTMFAPIDSADPSDVFHEVPMLVSDRHIIAVLVSSDGDLLTVETTKWAMAGGTNQGFSADPAPVQISFYRLATSDSNADRLRLVSAGTIRTRTAVSLPITTAGRLEVLDGGKNRWLFNFNEYAGKVDELAPFDTTCFPRPTFVGHGEFVVFGCRGGQDKLDFAGFNLKGEEMWQQNFYDTHVNPTFAFAPEAGRFALGRTIVSGEFDPELPLPAAIVTAQEVRVYQSYDGKQLFRTLCTPIERAGQNFTLSPDGLRLAVVRETMVKHPATKELAAHSQIEAGVEVYALPALTAVDRVAVKEAHTMAPPDTGARIDLALARGAANSAKKTGVTAKGSVTAIIPASDSPIPAAEPAPAMPQGSQSGAEAEASQSAGTATVGDAQPATPRKPPTLYGPDDKPQKPK